jgi:hypothetical protein
MRGYRSLGRVISPSDRKHLPMARNIRAKKIRIRLNKAALKPRNPLRKLRKFIPRRLSVLFVFGLQPLCGGS